MGDHTIILCSIIFGARRVRESGTGKRYSLQQCLKSHYTTASTQLYTPAVSRKLTSSDPLLSANVKETTCVLCGAFWAQLRNVSHHSHANEGSRDGTVGHHSGQLLKIRDAYSVAAWTGLYGHMYTGDYARAHGRYGSCKCLTSAAYKINCSRFTRDHSRVRGRFGRDTRNLLFASRVRLGVACWDCDI